MPKNIIRRLSLSLLASHFYLNTALASADMTNTLLEKYGTEFTSLEHKNLGDSVLLPLDSHILTLPNGMQLSYGEIIMYAADMFGAPYSSISSCAPKDRLRCFKAQFDAIAMKGSPSDTKCSNPLNQEKAIKKYMITVEKELNKARAQGITDWDFYDKKDVDITKQLNKLTCGGSFISGFFPFGTYIKLAEYNYDHFAPDSIIAYKTGHLYALQTAQQGFERQQANDFEGARKLLELAYAQNAFANHYLTDSFSAGHMRTPRRAIANKVLLPAALKLLLANLMHNEDNRHGLNVVNAEGNSWLAFGDGYLYKPEAADQRAIMLEAMQRSADQIFVTFQNGQIPEEYAEMRLFPDYSKIEQLNDTMPLFKVENGVLYKRVKNNDYYDNHWSRFWSGLITLIEFKVVN